MSDNVEHPSHYNAGNVETIEGIKAALGDGFSDYCLGNVLKYAWRCKHKGKLVEDLRKAAKYLEWAIEAAESNCPETPDGSSGKAIPIPDGWRELEPDEIPLATDMHEWMGRWLPRRDDATNTYIWHSSRHIRKIETLEPEQLAIPEGWRELEARETPIASDMVEHGSSWIARGGDSSVEYEWYDVRIIRKVEAANASEFPNSSIPEPGEGYRLLSKEPPEPVIRGDEFWQNFNSEWVESENFMHEGGPQAPELYYRRKIEPTAWIPKVGDRVRVNCPGRIVDGLDCVVTEAENGKYTAEHYSLTSGGLEVGHLELIEAAS